MLSLLVKYNFEVKSPTIIAGEFKNMKLLKIVSYPDAVLLDNSIPNVQVLIGYSHPETETYYVFEGDIVIAKDWIRPETLNQNVEKVDKVLTILDVDGDEVTTIKAWLDSMGYKYTEGA